MFAHCVWWPADIGPSTPYNEIPRERLHGTLKFFEERDGVSVRHAMPRHQLELRSCSIRQGLVANLAALAVGLARFIELQPWQVPIRGAF